MSVINTDAIDVKVSVAIWTYNHEQYIAQAIESALMQRTSFNYEVIIGEDCSTDATRTIVMEYAWKYPERIRLILHERNVGGRDNSLAVLTACQGEFIAALDGDDYWTDPHKLQKQVEFLEAHAECSMCFHDVSFVSHQNSVVSDSYPPPGKKAFYTLDDIVERCFIQTCSVLLRNGLLSEYLEWFADVTNGDWPLFVMMARRGNIGFLDEVMASYRIHGHGVWSSQGTVDRLQRILPLYELFFEYLDGANVAAIRKGACTTIAACAAAIYESNSDADLSPSLSYIETALASAIEAGYADRSFERVTWARSYEALGFTAYQKHHMSNVRYCFSRALALDPTLSKNLGILSLGFEALCGSRLSAFRRKLLARWRTYISSTDAGSVS